LSYTMRILILLLLLVTTWALWTTKLGRRPPSFELRIGELRDLPALVSVAHAEFQEQHESPLERQALWVVLCLGFSLRLMSDESVVVVAEEAGSLKGMAELSMQPSGEPAPAVPLPDWMKREPLTPYISNLLVTSDARRRGLGKQLVAFCERTAQRDWGLSTVALHFDDDDTRLHRFYNRLRFHTSGLCEFQGINLTYAVKDLSGPSSYLPSFAPSGNKNK